MSIEIKDLLQTLNILLLPAAYFIWRLERRLFRLELLLSRGCIHGKSGNQNNGILDSDGVAIGGNGS
jgi:hypothetical protein